MAAHPVVGPAGDWHREILREVVTGTGESRALTEYQHDPLGFVVDVLGVRRETLVWSENEGYENHKADRTELGEPTAPAPLFARPLPAR